MLDQESEPIARLLAAVLATHGAFTEAARSAGATGFAAEFAQRAEYQERIASRMRGMQAPVGMASNALWRVPDLGGGESVVHHPRQLVDKCLRVQDAATLEFCRGYCQTVALVLTDAIQAAQPIDTTRHHGVYSAAVQDEMDWMSPDPSQAS